MHFFAEKFGKFTEGGVNLWLNIYLKITSMKKLLIMLVAALAMVSCSIKDVPSVSFPTESYTVSSNGGELIIPVTSTGVDEVIITYRSGTDAWEVDPETGDRTPSGWIKLVKVIERHESTRALAQWTSGICLEIEPNDTGVEREGYVTVESFQAKAKVTIKQGF